jgi:protein ImuB
MAVDTAAADIARAIVVWCPDWPVRALLAGDAALGDHPIAVVEKGVVFACSATARAGGVRRGLRPREAQARCPELVLVPHDPALDARFFEPIVQSIESLVPGVELIRPGVCAVRARGPSRYYGGEERAAEALLELLDGLGVPDACIGIADGPFAAEQAARRTGRRRVLLVEKGETAAFLAGLGVDVLDDGELVTVLGRLGLRTLGDIAALDAVDLQNRFGEAGLRMHRLASGRSAGVVVPRVPRKALERSVSFEPGLDRIDQVAFGTRGTADDFIAGLTEAGLVCTALSVRVGTEGGETSERLWLHPRWFTAADVLDRVRWQLGAGGESGLASPIATVAIAPESVDAMSNHVEGLWGNGPDERVHHVLSRVQSMLGHEAVLTGALGGGRLLEDRQVLVPWGDPVPDRDRAAPWPGHLPPPLPGTVFAPPRSAAVLAGSGELLGLDDRGLITAEPALLVLPGRREPLAIVAWAGPWPIDEKWWDPAHARAASRFHLLDDEGTAWLVLLDDQGWSVEARYD